MKILISPAKSLDYDAVEPDLNYTNPCFLEDARKLVQVAQKLSVKKIAKLMKISDKLAELNFERFQNFDLKNDKQNNSKAAILVFNGDVYGEIDTKYYEKKHFNFLQENLRILSGLYGILRPLDLMQAYRLEMSTSLENSRGKNLYEFWGDKITEKLNEEEGGLIINLASEEYFKAVNPQKLKAKLISISFKEKRDGKFKIVGIIAKKMRGLMVDYIVKNSIKNLDEIKKFDLRGYSFNEELSSNNNFVYTKQ